VRKVTMYEAQDGELFKTKQGAENRNKKIVAKEITDKLKMTQEEIQEKLEKVAKRNSNVAWFLKSFGEWTKWPTNIMKSINAEILDDSKKITKYIFEHKKWGFIEEEELFVEEGPEHTDPELYCGDKYKVVRVEDENEFIKKVYYDYKYTWEEIVVKKIKEGEKLGESDLKRLVMEFDEVYRETGENRRWSRTVLSVLDINGELYALEWEEGLTESQENEFYEQPYPVKLETKEVTVKKTFIVKK